MLYIFKQRIYYLVTICFSTYFKNKIVTKLRLALNDKTYFFTLPEKEFLVFHFLLGANATIIDVGANNGIYCLYFKHIKQTIKIYAFEPLPKLFYKLKKWFKDIQLYNFALSNYEGHSTIYVPIIKNKLFESRAKLDDLTEIEETGKKQIDIKINTLDNVLKQINCIDLIKIDVEGHELKVIDGAVELIKKHNPYLLIEIEKRHHQLGFNNAIETVCKLGYTAFYFDYKKQKIENYIHYNVTEMQNLKFQNSFDYTNNFIFIPNKKNDIIASINKKINTYFS